MRCLLALLATAACAAAETSSVEEARARAERMRGSRPNVVMIFLDDLGFEPFADSMVVAPNIQKLAAEGMYARQHMVAHSICTPSRGALLTGRLSIRTGMYSGEDPNHIPPHTGDHRVIHPNCYGCLPENETTIAGMLGAVGYDTAAVSKWHLGYAGQRNFSGPRCLPTQRGFASFYGTPYTHCEGPENYPAVPIYRNLDRVARLGIDVQPDQLVDLYTSYATEYIHNHSATGSAPFFLYFALDATHSQVYYPQRFANATPRGPFGDAVAASDWAVGQIMQALDDAGIAEDTLVMYTGDNGGWKAIPPAQAGTTGQFQASWAAGEFTGNAGFDTGKGSTYEGGFRLPGVFRWPGTIPASSNQFELITTLDYLPTLAALAGAPLPQTYLDGRDVSPLLAGLGAIGPTSSPASMASARNAAREDVEQRPFFYYRGPVLQAVRGGGNFSRFKAHFATHSGFGHEPIVWHDPPIVFDVEQDAEERAPLDASDPTTRAAVAALTDMTKAHNATVVRGTPQFDFIAYTSMDCQGLTPAQSGCCLTDGGKCAP